MNINKYIRGRRRRRNHEQLKLNKKECNIVMKHIDFMIINMNDNNNKQIK